MKRIASIVLCVMGVSMLFAQNRSETTAEQEFLSSAESTIISELAASDDRTTKWLALDYAEIAVKEGRISDTVRQTLINLAGEGTLSVSVTNGRVVNNFPEVRERSCDLLGQIPTKESKEALKKVVLAEKEPMVASAAVRALAAIGMNDNNDTLDTIMWVQKNYAVLNPTGSLAFAILNAYEKFAPTVTDPLIKAQLVQSVAEIGSNYNFVLPIREKALTLLKTLSGK